MSWLSLVATSTGNPEYVLGSEGAEQLRARGDGSTRASYVPTGLFHAVLPGSRDAVCGASDLVVWNRRWGDSRFLGLCPRCCEVVPLT